MLTCLQWSPSDPLQSKTVYGKGPIPLSGERLRTFANYANYLHNTHSSMGMNEWFIPSWSMGISSGSMPMPWIVQTMISPTFVNRRKPSQTVAKKNRKPSQTFANSFSCRKKFWTCSKKCCDKKNFLRRFANFFANFLRWFATVCNG